MKRPLIERSVVELAAMVERNRTNPAELDLIRMELRHRSTPRAQLLRKTVADYLAVLEAEPAASAPPTPAQLTAPPTPPTPKANPMNDARRWTEEAVASLRTKLIDLSKKSPLISFKHGGRSASILRIVDERPDLLCAAIDNGDVGFDPLPGEDETPKDELTAAFRIAYERARLTDEAFLTATEKLGDDEHDAKEWQQAERTLRAAVRQQLGLPPLDYGKTLDVAAIARAHGFDPSYDLKASDDGDVAPHQEDDRLRVLLIAKELDKRLKTIWERYKGHERETGIDTLFLAIGFVEWFDEASPDTALHAPLLLLPVKLDRAIVRGKYEYRLSKREEPLEVNVALAEKMRRDWGLDLPALRDEETPEFYFVRALAVLKQGRRLSLRWFVTLSVLPPMILWKDLDPAAWPDNAFAEHRLLPGLLGAAQVAGEASPGETIDIDAPEWAKIAPALIRPADASQHNALIDMAAGHDLAIEGPPGTGKSETITNMIATALGAGKRVLFVAEKQAALRVVADRLRASGFGALLLELHGDNANRADVYDGLRERLKTRVALNPGVLVSQRLQLDQQRNLIRRYLSLIGEPLGSLNRTAYWLAWREIRLRSAFEPSVVDDVAARWQPADARTIDQAMLAERRGWLDTFGAALIALDRDRKDGERTRWVAAGRLDPFDQRAQLEAAAGAGRAARAMQQASSALEAIAPVTMPQPSGPLDDAIAQFACLEPFEPVAEGIARAALRDPDTARALLRQQTRWRQLCAKLAADVASPAMIDDEAISNLSTAIDGVSPVPLTVAIARERLGKIATAASMTSSTEADLRLLIERLDLDATLSVENMRTVLEAMAALGSEPATIIACYRPDLLDPLVEATLHSERARASGLRDERDAVQPLVTEAADEAEAAELNRIADVLTDSGAFARLFGSEYRAAKRRAARLIRDSSDRTATANLLRRVARHHVQTATFAGSSVVATWFPPVLWKGVDSDWDAIQRARAALTEARRRLAHAKSDGVLQRWLGFAPEERSRIDGGLGRALPMLVKLADIEFGAYPAIGVGSVLDSNQQALELLDAALTDVGALADGEIVREGQDLAVRLATMRASASDFAALATQDGLAWVSEVSEPLEPLARALGRADTLRGIDGPLTIVPALVESDTPVGVLDRLIAAGQHWRAARHEWREARSRLADIADLAPEQLGDTWRGLAGVLVSMASDEAGARLAADLKKYARVLDETGLGALGEAALAGVAAAEQLADLYELLLVRELLRSYLDGDGVELGRTGGLTLARARETFTRLDKELHELEAKAIVAKRLGDTPPRGIGHGPRGQYTEMELLDNELALKRPRTSIRDVVHRAGAAMQALKPVWMMSPTSAARYIRPGTVDFDLLVVDEASQMRPENAVSAILRGAQFVVVGDANQLPPSDHFQTSSDDGADDDSSGIAENTESILDLANQRFRHKRRLKWHYRSQHESLIQFSNRQFYQRDLVFFPARWATTTSFWGSNAAISMALSTRRRSTSARPRR